MTRTTLTFVAQHQSVTMVPMFDAFKFKPKGPAQWLQRLAWRFLNWRGAMEQAYEPTVQYFRHTIDSGSFIERIIRQKQELLAGFNKTAQRLIIGSEDYAELMGCLDVQYQHFSFDAKVHHGRRLLGLSVEVVPWIRGAVVMP